MLNKSSSYLVLFLAGLLLASLFLSLQQSRPLLDEGIYLTAAWLNSAGKTPYVDFFFMKPPGIVFSLSAWFSLFGAALFNARALMVVVSLATMLGVFFLSKKMFNQPAAIFSALFFVFWAVPFSAYWAILDPFLALIAVFSALFLYLFLTERKGWQLFLFGFLLGLAVVFKQTMVLFACAAGLLALFCWLRVQKGSLLRTAVTFVTAFLIAPLLFFLYLLRFNALNDFCTDVLHPVAMLQQLTVVTLDARVLIAVVAFACVPIALLALLKNYLGAGEKGREIVFISLFFAFGFANTLPFWGCCIHLIPALPFASILAGFLIAGAFRERSKVFSVFSVALLSVSVLAMVFFQGYYSSETYSFAGISEVAQLVAAQTNAGDKILVMPASTDFLVMPASADLYFLSKRQPATRMFYYFGAYSSSLQQQVVGELQQNKPKLVVYLSRDRADVWKGPQQVDAFIQQNYSLTREITLQQPLYKFFTTALIFEPKQG